MYEDGVINCNFGTITVENLNNTLNTKDLIREIWEF